MRAIFLFLRLFQILLWLILNLVYKLFQHLIWELNGTASALRQSIKDPKSKSSAQVLNIYGRFKFCDYIMQASKWDFILGHERFETPEYVLQDHITLYGVTHDEAVFVETTPGHKVWDSKYHPSFLMAAQYFAAKKVVIMPIESLHHLADKVGNPRGKLIILSNCARCGSTLMTQMFEATERFVAFGEPNCLSFLAKLNDSLISKEDEERYERLAISTIRLLCKPTEKGNELGYLIKTISPVMNSIPMLMKLFPESVHMYMYRNPIQVAQSLYRLSCSLYAVKIIYFFGKNSARRLSFLMSLVGFPSSQYRIKLKYDLSIGILNWCTLAEQYLKFRKSGLKIAAVRYEDLIKHGRQARENIFRYCELPIELAEKAGNAMKWDSQKGTPLAKEVLQSFPLLPCTGGARSECNRLMKIYGFPDLSEEFIAEGTITQLDNL